MVCANSAISADSPAIVAHALGVLNEVPDTTWARAVFKALRATAMATLASRAAGVKSEPADLSKAVDPRAIIEAEAAAARLLNAAAGAALALLSTRTPTATTLEMVGAVAQLTAALVDQRLVASNDSVEKV